MKRHDTLRDILHWVQGVHQIMADRMRADAELQTDERSKLLLEYLASHEENLAKVLTRFEQTANTEALNTWCTEYFDQDPAGYAESNDDIFSNGHVDDIIEALVSTQDQVVELFKHLRDQAVTYNSKDLLHKLTELEENEIRQMVAQTQRLADI